MKSIVICALCAGLVVACGSATPAPANAGSTSAATAPDSQKAKAHLENHVNYPASRDEILAACANTPEFSAGEKQWFSDHLPPGKYGSAADVEKALKL